MQIEVDSGVLKGLIFNGYDTLEAHDKDAGPIADMPGVSAGVYALNQSIVWRSTLAEFQDKLVPKVAELSGISRGVNTKATEKARERARAAAKGDEAKAAEAVAKVKGVAENAVPYFARVKANVSDEVWATIVAEAKSLAASTKVDATPGRRPSGPAKSFYAKADDILGRGPDGIARAVEVMSSALPEFDLAYEEDGETPQRDSLARMAEAYFNSAV